MQMQISPLGRNLRSLFDTSIGFDRLFGNLVGQGVGGAAADESPRYNIEVTDDNSYVITLAVPGFKRDDLSITAQNNALVVRGTTGEQIEEKKPQDGDAKAANRYLHCGFVTQGFEHRFGLAEHIEVQNAELDHGILKITLTRNIPEEAQPKQVSISVAK